MARASLIPSPDSDIHLVLCRFGRAGLAYIETDPAEADATRVVQNLLFGRYDKPLRVVALNLEEGWSRDVSETMAFKVREMARQDDIELTDGTLAFIDAHTEATPSADIAALVNPGEQATASAPLRRSAAPSP